MPDMIDTHVIEVRRLDGILGGVAVYHDCIDGIRTYHWAPVSPKLPYHWDLISEDPIHIEPSLLCRACGDHGFVRNGLWVAA